MAKTFRKFRKGKIPFQEATRCIFCDHSRLNLEHVFSRWTHRFLPPRAMKKYQVVRVDAQITQSDRYMITRAGDIRDWQIRCVCENNCNNGWMRQNIENVARPIMIPLIQGGQTLRLSSTQQEKIAAWAVLKAMIAEFDPHGWVTTHHMHRKYLMKHFAPPVTGWVVWIGAYQRVRWPPHWVSTPFLYLSPKQEARRSSNLAATHFNGHISTMVIGQLFIQVISSPASHFINRWRFSVPHKGTLFRIWPPSGVSINWPSQIMTDQDADYVASAMYNFLMDRIAPELAAGIAKGQRD
jgi:hypothetical protein